MPKTIPGFQDHWLSELSPGHRDLARKAYRVLRTAGYGRDAVRNATMSYIASLVEMDMR